MRSSSVQSPGSRLTLVMRISGMRFQEEALMQPLDSSPKEAADSRDIN